MCRGSSQPDRASASTRRREAAAGQAPLRPAMYLPEAMSDDTRDGLRDPLPRRGARERLAASVEAARRRLAPAPPDNPLGGGAIARAFEAREKASQAQEL